MKIKGIIVIGVIITIIVIALAFPTNPLDFQPKITDSADVKDSADITIDKKIELDDEASTIVEEKKHYTISVRDEPIIP